MEHMPDSLDDCYISNATTPSLSFNTQHSTFPKHSMHSTLLRSQLLLLLLLALGHVVAGEGQFNDLFIIFFVIFILVLMILLLSIHRFCWNLQEREKVKEKSIEVVEEGEAEFCRASDHARSSGESDQKDAVIVQEPGKITFTKGMGDFNLTDLFQGSAEGLGKGGFGSCYKTKLENDKTVVVKRLRDLGPVTMEEFMKYMRFLSSMEHPNLLPLLGYYYSATEKLMISNYASNGNLFYRIHGRSADRSPFTWASRLKVAYGVAQAMEFLHRKMNGAAVVPHGNLKTSNVLLGENDKPLICDYGLLPLVSPSLAVHRMVCYRSPDHQQNQMVLSKKTDVWSYGCLLLELMTGRISMNSKMGGIHGIHLCHWVNRAVREEWTAEVFDNEILKNTRESNGMIKLLKLALWCCEWSPEKRPDMGEVVAEVGIIMTGRLDAESDSSYIDSV
ncbi:pollen receptor-like kinase 2 [Zingiber officinale]|uniref:pollen receptor-like kinase 2 n=1 Tax=Zingiber officinale TaxID=94328 RepID=UPI001C4B9330|nr:pollen receptor-like kinase 2 [Zingiber officinale]